MAMFHHFDFSVSEFVSAVADGKAAYIGLLREMPANDYELTYSTIVNGTCRANFYGYSQKSLVWPGYPSRDGDWIQLKSDAVRWEATATIDGSETILSANVVGWFVFTPYPNTLLWVAEFSTPQIMECNGDDFVMAVDLLAKCDHTFS